MIVKREAYLNARKPKPQPRQTDVKYRYVPSDADGPLLMLGIATRHPAPEDDLPDYERLLLEPWAVQAALDRRRGGDKLTEREREEIRRCTRDAANLRWPSGANE